MRHFLSAFLVLFLFSSPGHTQQTAPVTGVVDLEDLSLRSKATIDLATRVEAATTAFRQSMMFKYEKLQDDLRTFQVEAAGLPARERTDRDERIRQQIADLTAEETEGLAAIDARAAATMASLQGEFRAVMTSVAENLELDLILEKNTYDQMVADGLVPAGAQDVTGLVLVFLDDRVPTSGFSMEGEAP